MIGRTRTVMAGLCVAGATVAAVAIGSPVHADIRYVASPTTSAFVTEVGLNQGNGMIDVQVRQPRGDRMTGVLVRIAAGNGSWGTRTVNTGGAHCVASDGPGLQYVCRPVDGGLMPTGTYDLVLPVARRTGGFAGLWGSVSILRENNSLTETDELTFASDTFPVVDKAVGTRSTGEVRALNVVNGRGTLSVTAIIAPGEQVDAVVLRVPGTSATLWTLRGTGPAANGATCAADNPPGTRGAASFTCIYGTPGNVFPLGLITINLPLTAANGKYNALGSVALRTPAGVQPMSDSFGIWDNFGGCC